MTVVAEGIETQDHYQLLRNEGCEQAQGFFLSKPQSAQNIALMLEQQGIEISLISNIK